MVASKMLKMGQCGFPCPFHETLEYNPPARGMWNIVHVGMLIPESHQIFVCAGGCLRGVVLTAAEMGAEKRFSTVDIEEFETIDGSMEQNMIDGISDVIDRLDEKPKAILVYTSCIHHFLNVDLERLYRILREKYPVIEFTDCYMTPTMRKSGINPDEKMRMQLYSLITAQKEDDGITFLGDVYPCDIRKLVEKSGRKYREICGTKTWEEYQELGKSGTFLYANPAARKGAEALGNRLGRKLAYLPYSFDPSQIADNMKVLSTVIPFQVKEMEWKEPLERARKMAEGYEIAIDYTATARPLSLARLLLGNGFAMRRIYLDSFPVEEKADWLFLKERYPDLLVVKASHPDLPFDRPAKEQEKVLAIGQKSAYYEHTAHFVNLIADGGHWGYEAIVSLSEEIVSAINERKPVEEIITVKGWGCRL